MDRLYNTSLNKYKDERIKELQKKYAINSTKKKKVNMDRIAELFAGGIKNKNKAEQEKEKMLQEVNNSLNDFEYLSQVTDEFNNQRLSKTSSFTNLSNLSNY